MPCTSTGSGMLMRIQAWMHYMSGIPLRIAHLDAVRSQPLRRDILTRGCLPQTYSPAGKIRSHLMLPEALLPEGIATNTAEGFNPIYDLPQLTVRVHMPHVSNAGSNLLVFRFRLYASKSASSCRATSDEKHQHVFQGESRLALIFLIDAPPAPCRRRGMPKHGPRTQHSYSTIP